MGEHSWFDWSSWVFGLLGLTYIVYSELRAKRDQLKITKGEERVKRATLDSLTTTTRLASQLKDSSAGRVTASTIADANEEIVRATVIQVAADSEAFKVVLARTERLGVDWDTVAEVAKSLRDAGIIQYADPLDQGSMLQLT